MKWSEENWLFVYGGLNRLFCLSYFKAIDRIGSDGSRMDLWAISVCKIRSFTVDWVIACVGHHCQCVHGDCTTGNATNPSPFLWFVRNGVHVPVNRKHNGCVRLASLGRPRCVAVFFPGRTWVIICTRLSWKKTHATHRGRPRGAKRMHPKLCLHSSLEEWPTFFM